MSAYCPHLWKTVTIDHKGDIYHCCKIQPLNLGSIYEHRLEDVLNASAMQEIRTDALAGSLPCYADCNLIEKDLAVPDRVSGYCDYRQLTDLYVDFGMKCNICCIMCRQRTRYLTDKRGLSCEILVKHIDFTPFQHIFIQGGEPLYIDECLKFMTYLHTIGKRYSLLTNGLLIDAAMAQRLAEEAELVSISLNAATRKTHETVNKGSSWETVLSNIAELRRCRDESGSPLSINGRMTITVNAVAEIPQFLSRFAEFGFDTANFGYDRETVPVYLEAHPDITRNLRSEIAAALRSIDSTKVDTLRLEQLGLWENR